MIKDISSSSNNSLGHYFQIALSFSSIKLGLLFVRHPIHVIGTCKQASPTLTNIQIIADIYKNNGIKGFYKSTSTSILKICLAESYRGVLMIQVPKQVQSCLPKHWSQSYPTTAALTTSAIAVPIISAVDTCVICPLLRISTLQMTINEKHNLKAIYNRFIKGNIITALYRGYTPLFIQTSFLWGNFFIIDDLMKRALQKHFHEISYSGLAATSIIGGCLQTCINVIPDTVRVQMQKSASNKLSMRTVTKQLVQQHGIHSLFSAIPHKLIGGIIGYSYKSMLRHFWTTHDNKS